MRELRPGLRHWEAPHTDWEPSEPWQKVHGAGAPWVSSYAIDDGERLLLLDPLAVPSEIEELAVGRETAILPTGPWHERDTRSLVERLGTPVFVPRPDEGSPDVAWLQYGDTFEGHLYSSGDRLPVGVEAFPGKEPNDVVLWSEAGRAVIAGDTLVDFGHGLEIPAVWLGDAPTREQIADALRPQLALPVEHVLATHGGPTDRAALERALA